MASVCRWRDQNPPDAERRNLKVVRWLKPVCMDTVIATNTTLGREGVHGLECADRAGGAFWCAGT
jgi:dihydroorotate dehydrogenase